METLIAKSLYVRVHSKKGGTTVHEHRVWNEGGRLLQSLQEDHAKEGGVVEVISKEEYDAERFSAKPKRKTTKREK